MFPGASTLTIPAFRNLFYGQSISLLGDSLYYLVIFYMAGKASNNADWAVGMVGAAQALPFLLSGPFGGQMADRLDRRKIMLWADLLSAIITGLLAIVALWSPVPNIWVIGATGFLLSTVNSVFMPARSAAIPRLVPEDELMSANGLIMTTQQIVQMAGIAFSAFALGAIEKFAPNLFLTLAAGLNSLTFLGSALFIYLLPAIQPKKEEIHEQHILRDIGDGLKAVWKNPFTQIVLPVALLFQLSISGFFVIYVSVNNKWFGGHYSNLAWIEFSFMVILAVMSMMMGWFKVKKVGWSYAIAIIGIGVLVGVMGIWKNYWVFLLLNALCGVFVPFAWLPLTTYLQSAFPDNLRGRVSSVFNMVHGSMQPISMAVVGPLISGVGITNVFYLMGIGMTSAGVGALFFPGFRGAELAEDSAQTSQQ